MAKYKVSYKVLGEQGETLKSTAKMMDDYAQRVTNINGRLGNDQMLSSVRTNLQKLAVQLGESRAIINMAGEVLTKSVGGYTALEKRQVTKVDGLKAHNRDFYKNPVVVASAGGAAAGVAGGAAAAATPMTATVSPPAAPTSAPAPQAAQPGDTTLNYTENNTYVTYNAAPAQPPIQAAVGAAQPETPAASGLGAAAVAGIGAGAAVLGAAAAVGAGQIKKHAKGKKNEQSSDQPTDAQLEDQLEQAMARVRLLNREAETITPQTED